MIQRHCTGAVALACLAMIGSSVTWAGSVWADTTDPSPTPVTQDPPTPQSPLSADMAAMTPNQQAVPPDDPAAPPPARDPFAPYVPEIQNPTYGSGNSGGGVFGTLKDLWQQVQNPTFAPNEIMGSGGGAPAPPPGSAAPPPLPPGYVSINLPGSETPGNPSGAGGSASMGPALPPGYYPISGPPPPGYSYSTTGSVPAAPMTPAQVVPNS